MPPPKSAVQRIQSKNLAKACALMAFQRRQRYRRLLMLQAVLIAASVVAIVLSSPEELGIDLGEEAEEEAEKFVRRLFTSLGPNHGINHGPLNQDEDTPSLTSSDPRESGIAGNRDEAPGPPTPLPVQRRITSKNLDSLVKEKGKASLKERLQSFLMGMVNFTDNSERKGWASNMVNEQRNVDSVADIVEREFIREYVQDDKSGRIEAGGDGDGNGNGNGDEVYELKHRLRSQRRLQREKGAQVRSMGGAGGKVEKQSQSPSLRTRSCSKL